MPEIKIKSENPVDQAIITASLQQLADTLSRENLQFLAEMSKKPNINEKLESKKNLIKTFL